MGEILFTTNDAANMLRVDKSTIKRWTDEGKLKCLRTPGGHRKFKSDDLYSFMAEFKYGDDWRQTLPHHVSDDFVIRNIVQNKEYNILHSVCFSDSLKGKKDEVIELFNEVFRAGMSVALMFDHILMPTLKKIEYLFSQNKIVLSEYKLAQNVLSSAVIQLNDFIEKREKNYKTVVCASIDSGKNDTELKALNTLLEINGYTILNLGMAIDADALLQFLSRTKPFAIYLYIFNQENIKSLYPEIVKIIQSVKKDGAHCVIGGSKIDNNLFNQFSSVTICSSFLDFELINFKSNKELEKNI